MENPSLLRFLVDMRGEDTTSRQLRDDLMTMLIAGHETTAAVLTWAMFELVRAKFSANFDHFANFLHFLAIVRCNSLH